MANDLEQSQQSETDRLTLSLFAKFDTLAFIVASACVAGLVMFLATAALLVAGPAPGYPVGPNLSAFSTFWPGYSVSWPGAFVGAIYAGAVGGLVGFSIAVFWNLSHIVIIGLAALRRAAWE